MALQIACVLFVIALVVIAVVSMSNDPVRNCDVYKKEGCSHVDGYLCDMKTCGILKSYKEIEEFNNQTQKQ